MIRIEASIALIGREGRWFLQRRDPRSSVFGGLWEFPGGKLEAGEDPAGALRRELREELDWVPENLEPLPPLGDPGGNVRLHPFRCWGPAVRGTPLAWGWFTRDEIAKLPFPPLNGALLRFLE